MDQLARGADLHAVAQADAAQRVMGEGQPFDQRHPHMVGEFQRRRPGAAFLAVHDDEIGRDPGFQHRPQDAHEFAPVTDAKLEADGLALGQFAHVLDELHHLDRGREGGMRRGGDTVLAHRNVARLGDLGGDLGGGQHAALTGLGALAQLQLHHLHLIFGGHGGELVGIEAAVMVAAAEIARSQLEHDVAAALAVIAADPALAAVMVEIAHLGALVQRQDRIGRQRPEAHRRDVVDRGAVGLRTIRPADGQAKVGVLDLARPDRMGQPLVAAVIDPLLGAEGALVLDVLGALVDDGARLARERHLFLIALDQVLANLRPDQFKEIAHMAEDRIVAQDRVIGLRHVAKADE